MAGMIGVQTFKVEPKKTYLIRIINTGLDNDYYFSVAGHKLTVVGADGGYLKPFVTTYVPIQPGQTIDVTIHTTRKPGESKSFGIFNIRFSSSYQWQYDKKVWSFVSSAL